MTTITIPDNNSKVLQLTNEQVSALTPIVNKNIKSIIADNPSLLVFPRDLGHYADGLDENDCFIAKVEDKCISTTNMVGFVECNNIRLKICSRFDSHKDEYGNYSSNDQFFMYMLSRVLSINVFDMNLNAGGLSAMNLLLLLFPHYLKSALSQGIYKEYQRYSCNDPNVKGVIDINRHIRKNIPFSGNIAYSMRIHSYDNSITELIRHTIEFISTQPMGKAIINSVHDETDKIRLATPSYQKRQRNNIINKNLRPKVHPYYSKYKALQELCLQILRYESQSYGENKKQMKGIIFNAAWLWEEYLNKLLSECGYKHPTNKENKGGLRIFKEIEYESYFTKGKRLRRIYPDFYNSYQVIDAKYKQMDMKSISRSDLYQIISYMHTMKIDIGGFISPSKETCPEPKIFELTGYGGYIYNIPMEIPQGINNPTEFKKSIMLSEKKLQQILKTL